MSHDAKWMNENEWIEFTEYDFFEIHLNNIIIILNIILNNNKQTNLIWISKTAIRRWNVLNKQHMFQLKK